MTAKSKTNSEDQSAPAPLRFLRQPEVLARVGVAWITILRWEEAGGKLLPPPMFDRYGERKSFTRY